MIISISSFESQSNKNHVKFSRYKKLIYIIEAFDTLIKLGNCETHNLSLLYMQIKQLQRRYYEVGTKEGPNLLGRFLSTIGI